MRPTPTVGQYFRRGVPSVSPRHSLETAARLLHDYRVDVLVVVDRSRPVGVLTAVQIADAWPSITTSLTYGEQAGRLADIRVGAVMNRDVVAVAPETPLAEAARLLRDLQCGVLPVIADAAVVGTLSVRDLVALLGRTVANSS
jgi:acetoin utilization protein AcuB